MSFNKCRTLMKAFIESQFNYCPLIWMFHSRTMNNKINRIHERALRLVYSDHASSLAELLKKRPIFFYSPEENSKPSYWTLQFFSRSFNIMKNVFHFDTNIPYNFRSRSELYSKNPKTIKYGAETISYLAPKIWSLVPNVIKSRKSLDVFKSKIRQWEFVCSCSLCKIYLQHVGFI